MLRSLLMDLLLSKHALNLWDPLLPVFAEELPFGRQRARIVKGACEDVSELVLHWLPIFQDGTAASTAELAV